MVMSSVLWVRWVRYVLLYSGSVVSSFSFWTDPFFLVLLCWIRYVFLMF